MFTLKLYAEGRHRIAEAEGFTVYHLSDYAIQITAHNRGDGATFYVGDNSGAPTADIANEIWYGRAIIENASGKTSEIIQPPPKLVTSISAGPGVRLGDVGDQATAHRAA